MHLLTSDVIDLLVKTVRVDQHYYLAMRHHHAGNTSSLSEMTSLLLTFGMGGMLMGWVDQ
jgi:hypothetical protein